MVKRGVDDLMEETAGHSTQMKAGGLPTKAEAMKQPGRRKDN